MLLSYSFAADSFPMKSTSFSLSVFTFTRLAIIVSLLIIDDSSLMTPEDMLFTILKLYVCAITFLYLSFVDSL